MRMKFAPLLAPALALGFMAVTAEAQQHRAIRLGNPATRFAKPMKKPDDLRVLLRSDKMRADVLAVLAEAGWKGNIEDLDRAAASAEISEVQIQPGTRLPFMASRKNKKAHALIDVLWAGRKPIDAYSFEFSSSCERFRLFIPKPCSNFWIEDVGKDTTDQKCLPPPPPPVVSLSGAGEACVTQPVEYTVTVKNPPPDNRVALSFQGKEVTTGTLSNGTFRYTFPGSPTPGSYEVKATSGGVTGTSTLQVKPCLPTCGITVTPQPAKAGKPITVDLTGSRVAAGVKGGIKTAKVEIVDAKGTVVQTVDMGGGTLSRNDIVIKKSGLHTLRAVVTDEATQTSTNACQAQVDVKGGPPIFLGGYFGKERLTHDSADDHPERVPFTPFSRCAPQFGVQAGFQPMIGEKANFEAAVGLKIAARDESHTTAFIDGAVNYVATRAFVGGGVSYWDIGKDSTGVGLLVQFGFDLDKDGKWQIVAQSRAPFFNRADNIKNNYQFWGGLRFRPFHWE